MGRLEPQVRADLARVLPGVAVPPAMRAGALQHERYLSHRAVRELLQLLAEERPVVLLLDDLHWADPASAELLVALLRRPPVAPVLLGLARRPRQTDQRLAAALNRAERTGGVVRRVLRPLTPAQAAELLGPSFPPDLATALCEECGGNPFYLQQLARVALVRTPVALASARDVLLAGVQVPESVAVALTEELEVLTPRARLVLDGAAVVGDPFETDLAAIAADLDEDLAVAALDDLLALDVVRPTAVPRRYRFRHPILRRAAYETARGAWRVDAHERVARALALRGAGVTARAAHVERCARRGDPEAVALLRTAGDESYVTAPGSAARWYRAAAEVLGPDAEPGERVALLLPQATALAATGDYHESHAALVQCLEMVVDDPGLRTQLIASCAALEQLLGDHARARARLLEALDHLPPGASRESAAFMVELAMDGYFAMRYDVMEDWARKALDAGIRISDPVTQVLAGAALSLAGALAGTAARARRDCAWTAALVDRLPDEVVAARLDAVGYLALAEQHLELFDEARAHADRAVRLARSTGQGQTLPLSVPSLASLLALRGSLAPALRLMDDAVELARLTDYARAVAWVLTVRAQIRLAAGDLAGALTDAQEALDALAHLDEEFVLGWAGVQLAQALLESGKAGRAVAVLDRLAGGEAMTAVHGGWRAHALELRTRCLLDLGRVEQAGHAATVALRQAEEAGLSLASAVAMRAAAAVHLGSARPAAAVDAAGVSMHQATALGAPLEATHSRILLGRALAAEGSTSDALSELRRAATTAESLGALRLRDAAEHEIRALGAPVHRRTAAARGSRGYLALTGREREVAALVAQGRTNPEIAATLFLSLKTVETHLRHIFRKLEVSSRLAVAREVDRVQQAAGRGTRDERVST